MRFNVIINQLISLKDNLDIVFEEIGEELENTENENEGLKKKLREIQNARFSAENQELLELRRNQKDKFKGWFNKSMC